jgi:GNAT superfamily N-acetyltransferase
MPKQGANMMEIREVQTRVALKHFYEFPYRFYRDDPLWVPPLRSEARGQFDPKHNPFLDHCDYALFLLERDSQVIGRIAAFIDTLAVAFWGEPIGLFGYYECVSDSKASKLLLEAAADWLRRKGMSTMRGPWSFVSQEWGLVVEGFDHPPVIMAPHNPVYYDGQMTAFGLEKVKDLLCYYISAREGYEIPERILTLTDRVAERYSVTIRQLDMRQYDQEVQVIMELSNISILDNWGYSPVTEAEAQAVARDLKQIVQPEGVLFAEDAQGRAIGFAIALPDMNVLLKDMNGRLLPFGWLRLLRGLPRLSNYRMFALGVLPEYHGKGIDSLIYRGLYESLFTPDLWMEINYVLEDNVPMNNAIRKLNANPMRRYRIYEMTL